MMGNPARDDEETGVIHAVCDKWSGKTLVTPLEFVEIQAADAASYSMTSRFLQNSIVSQWWNLFPHGATFNVM